MTIHKEGYKTIAIATLVFTVLNLLSFFFISAAAPWLSWLLLIALFGLLLFIISFFRIPNRVMTVSDKQVICPADGKVVVIEEITDV